MANETRPETQHHPDTRRDFETGTVNPGPGMAGPIGGKKANPGKDTDRQRQSPQQQAEQTGRQANADDQR
jgi:hypothetical protein